MRAAVRLMYVGAAVSTVNLIMLLAVFAVVKTRHVVLGHSLTAAQISQLNALDITVWVVWSLVPVAVWLWMAQANGQGKSWARSLSTVLFGMATLDLTGALSRGIRLNLVPAVFGPAIPVLTWLTGLAAVWLLWRPASTAYFKPQGPTPAGHSAQPTSQIGSPSSWRPRQL